MDSRLRPAAVRRWRFLGACEPFSKVAWLATGRVGFAPSSAAIALSRRFLSALSSDTILCVSNVPPILVGQVHLIVAELLSETNQTGYVPVAITLTIELHFHSTRFDGRDAAFCLETIFTSQPFRERSCTDSYLCASEHPTKERNFSRKVSLWMPPCLALYDNLPLNGPEQSPFWRKFLYVNQIGWTQIKAALAHSGMRIPPDSLCRIA